MRTMTRDGRASADVHLKALIYSKPGGGKTSFGVSAPKPLILLSERQGFTHIEQAAERLGRQPVGVLYMEHISDYRNVARELTAATLNPSLRSGPFRIRDEDGEVLFESAEWPESIVIDSLTDACRLVEGRIDEESPPKLGRDGLPTKPERFWQVLKDRCEKLVRSFRDVDFHVIFLCLEDDKMNGEGEEAERSVRPSLPMRALPDFVCAAVNVVGIAHRRIRTDQRVEGGDVLIEYVIRTVGPSWYTLKPYRPLRDVEVPDFSAWVEAVRGNRAITAPAAPTTPATTSNDSGAAPTSTTSARTRGARRPASSAKTETTTTTETEG